MLNIPEGILCTRLHSWVLEDNNIFYVGITYWQVNHLGDIVSVELPEIGSCFNKNEVFTTIESVRDACELYMPVECEIVEINDKLINFPELINENCYENWIAKIKPQNFQQDTEDLIEYVDYIDEVS